MAKRAIVLCTLLVALLLATAAPALATSQNYTKVLPRFGKDAFTTSKTVKTHKDFGARHRYSGGKRVHFTACNTSGTEIGGDVAIMPGGANAPLTDIWYNDRGSARTIKIKMETDWNVAVEVLAEGTWVWNY